MNTEYVVLASSTPRLPAAGVDRRKFSGTGETRRIPGGRVQYQYIDTTLKIPMISFYSGRASIPLR